MSVSNDLDLVQREQDINKIVKKHIKNLPQKQRCFVLTHIRAICLGNLTEDSGLLAIRGKFGVQAEVTGKKILTEALKPTLTSDTMHPYL